MQSSIASAETLGHNEDLLKELLLRLPAKSLIRFKCVSKLWLSLISSPKFCDSHTLQNPVPKFSSAFFISKSCRNPTIEPHFISLLPNTNHPNPSEPLNFIPDRHGLTILQSCNGLLLCSTYTYPNPSKYYVVNPTTRRFSEIDLPPLPPKPSGLVSLALAFDPSKSPHYYVVLVSGSGTVYSTRREVQIEMYSSQTRTWRVCELTDKWFPTGDGFEPGVYCNGRINWLGAFCFLVHYHIDEGHLGVVHEHPGHDFWSEEQYTLFQYIYCGESSGCLHLIEMFMSDVNQLAVLEMRKDYSGWFVKYQVDLNLIRAVDPHTLPCPFLFLDEEENEEQNPVLLFRIGYKVISFNIRDRSCKTLCNLTASSQVEWSNAYRYMETLACV